MELQGELSDFPLADIVQIICLSKKTGTLLVSGGDRKGMVVFVRGKIVQAITDASPGSLGELLIERQIIGTFELEQALKMQHRTLPHRLLGSLLVELGFIERYILNQRIREQIHHAISGMVVLKRGSFELKLNVIPIGRSRPYPGQDFVLAEGVEVEELLLEIATAMDEAQRDELELHVPTGSLGLRSTGPLMRFSEATLYDGVERAGDFTPILDRQMDEDPELLLARLDPGGSLRSTAPSTHAPATDRERFLRLHALLVELKHQTAHSEVALTILRYASEVAPRGVLFVVKEREICGQGQFGVKAGEPGDVGTADARVRKIRLPLDGSSVLADVVRTGHPRIGRLEHSGANLLILDRIGGADIDLIAAAIPMLCEQRVRLILYVDNFPGDREFRGLPELELLVDQAGVVMEKILLEQKLSEIGNGRQ